MPSQTADFPPQDFFPMGPECNYSENREYFCVVGVLSATVLVSWDEYGALGAFGNPATIFSSSLKNREQSGGREANTISWRPVADQPASILCSSV